MTAIWNRFALAVGQFPGPIFAVLLVALALALCVTTVVFLLELRGIRSRHRQLAQQVDALASSLQSAKAALEEKSRALSERPDADAIRRNSDRDLPAALIREELESLQMDLRAPDPIGGTAPAAEG